MFILPWAGSRQFRTLERLLKNNLKEPLGLRSVVPMEPYYMVVAGKVDAEKLEDEIIAETAAATDALTLLKPDEALISANMMSSSRMTCCAKPFRSTALMSLD